MRRTRMTIFSFSFDLAEHIFVILKDEAPTLIITHRHHCQGALSSSKIVEKMVMLQWNFSFVKRWKLFSFVHPTKQLLATKQMLWNTVSRCRRSVHRSQTRWKCQTSWQKPLQATSWTSDRYSSDVWLYIKHFPAPVSYFLIPPLFAYSFKNKNPPLKPPPAHT